jgi:hypothetical protein
MKIKHVMKKFITLILLIFTVSAVSARKNEVNADSVKKLIDSKSFVFVAQSAIPMKGKFISLSSSYNVKFVNDSIISYLPYYGTAHTAIFPGEDSGIMFTSADYKYEVKPVKSGWNVTVKPKDLRNNVELYFNISKSGGAMLRVSDYRRDAISFRGYISLD